MKIKRPMVSVVMITYNHEKYIRQAIDSILMQKVDFDYEIVIGEDKSPDNTRAILLEYKEKYPNKFKLLLRNENMGPTKNLYDVYMNCTGKYIAILEGDDYWTDEHKLKVQVEFLENNKNYIASSHFVSVVNKYNEKIGTLPSNNKITNIYNIEDVYKIMKKSVAIHVQSLVFINIFYNSKNKYFKMITSASYSCDFTLLFLLAYKGKINIKNKNMATYRFITNLNSTSYTSLKDEDRALDYINVIKGIKKLFKNKKSIYYRINLNAKTNMLIIKIKNFNFKDILYYYINSFNSIEKFFLCFILFKRFVLFFLKKINLLEYSFLKKY